MKKKVFFALLIVVVLLCVCFVGCDNAPKNQDNQVDIGSNENQGNQPDISNNNTQNEQTGGKEKYISRLSPDAKDGGYISVLIHLAIDEEPPVDQSMLNGTTHEEIDAQLEAYRKAIKNFYMPKNQALVEDLSLDEYDYTVSYYGPFVELAFRSIAEYRAAETKLKNIVNSSDKVISATASQLVFSTCDY